MVLMSSSIYCKTGTEVVQGALHYYTCCFFTILLPPGPGARVPKSTATPPRVQLEYTQEAQGPHEHNKHQPVLKVIVYFHTTAGFPPKQTIPKAIKVGDLLLSWPGLTFKRVEKELWKTPHDQPRHLQHTKAKWMTNANSQSTKEHGSI